MRAETNRTRLSTTIALALALPIQATASGGPPLPPESVRALVEASDVVALVRLGERTEHVPAPGVHPLVVFDLVVEASFEGDPARILLVGSPPPSIRDQPILAFLSETGNPGVYTGCCGDSFFRSDVFGDLVGQSGPLAVRPDGAFEAVHTSKAEIHARLEQRFPMLLDPTFAGPSTFDALTGLDLDPSQRPLPVFTDSHLPPDPAAPSLPRSTAFADLVTVTRFLTAGAAPR
ncbi:MAG: hypothetical protein H6737_12035 [Alphaproteobacteria bacterium]|nr:hypothetical protein [Alphaproteobacteria bacterium]